jgi:predicted Zn-ribbon and HTH transcriptional regulator
MAKRTGEQKMKIFKKPKILPCECRICGAVFQPKWVNVKYDMGDLRKDTVYCPFCKSKNIVKFEKGADNDLTR